MALDVIGAGWGRTGTETLKAALEILGFGPCHHMHVLRDQPEFFPVWQAFAEGAHRDWDALYAGFRSGVDFPTAAYWRELSEHFPQARVILTTRDPQKWIESLMASALRLLDEKEESVDPHHRAVLDFTDRIVVQGYFSGIVPTPKTASELLAGHEADLRATIPAERLLVYRVSEGWEPLAAFLGVPVPDRPFPFANARGEYREHWT